MDIRIKFAAFTMMFGKKKVLEIVRPAVGGKNCICLSCESSYARIKTEYIRDSVLKSVLK